MHWILSHPILAGIAAAIIFELATIILRFGFKMTSPTHTRPISKVTKGYRIHHGYPGIPLLFAVPLLPAETIISSIVIIFAIMLFLSDFIHHAIILPIFAGSHEFYIKYPAT
tara:strand:+ start:442431 stop:442766 length:336 start_codon:yes stop_codon:yes gene_type:complete